MALQHFETMTNHVPKLKTCRKLEAAGFPQDSYFYWIEYPLDGGRTHPVITDKDAADLEVIEIQRCAAPILTEILEQLPRSIEVDGVWGYFLRIEPMIPSSNWRFNYSHMKPIEAIHKNPAESAALLWLELNPVP